MINIIKVKLFPAQLIKICSSIFKQMQCTHAYDFTHTHTHIYIYINFDLLCYYTLIFGLFELYKR